MKVIPSILIDFYKSGHLSMLPEGSTLMYSNFTPRSGHHFPVAEAKKVLWVGMQGILKWLVIDTWNKGFFQRPVGEVIGEYKDIMDKALGPDLVSFKELTALHKLGYLPLHIKALPEGSMVPFGVPVFTIRNTHPEFAFLGGYFEDMLSCETWPVMTVATLAYYFREMLEEFAAETGVCSGFVDWQSHCFAFRGMRGIHDGTQSLTGHMYCSLGTDSIPVIPYLEEYYGAKDAFIGGSVPATEHAVMCMLISKEMNRMAKAGIAPTTYTELWREAERNVFRWLITEKHPTGIISIVSDTKNLWDVLDDILPSLKAEILGRGVNALGLAKVVVRPDSGDPETILCGYTIVEVEDLKQASFSVKENQVALAGGKYYLSIPSASTSWEYEEIREAQALGAVRTLWKHFGGTVNEAGFKVLHERVGLIYGDSINFARGHAILARLKEMGFASNSTLFGRGSFGSVFNTRDSTGSAFKATYGECDGVELELYKDPITDDGTKRSAKGLLRVEREGDTFVLYDQQTWEQEASGVLETVFLDGKLMRDESLATIRARVGFIH
jgi:nicotinamide phosphoribosyltransferase